MSEGRVELDRRIARLAVPALGAIAAEPLYNLADTAIVGHLGRGPLDALAIASSTLSTVVWLAIFLSTATTTQVARRAARGEPAAAGRAVGAAYAVAAGWGAVTSVVVAGVAPWKAAGSPTTPALAGPSCSIKSCLTLQSYTPTTSPSQSSFSSFR